MSSRNASTGSRRGVSSAPVSPAGKKLPPPPGSLLLSAREWERIRSSADTSKLNMLTPAQRVVSEKQKQYEDSKAQVAQWASTIATQREAKLKVKAQREAEAEARQQAIDEEEARFQEEERQKIIERAKAVQYMQNDRVKQVNAALVTAEVLRERERQLGGKDKRQQFGKQLEAERVQAVEADRQEAIQRELEKQKQARLDALMLAEGQLQQAAQKRQERRQQREDHRAEADLLEMNVRQYKDEEVLRSTLKKEKAHHLTSEFQMQIGDTEARRHEELQREREAEENMRRNALELQRKNEERRQAEKSRRQQMEDQRDKTRQAAATSKAVLFAKEEEIRARAADEQLRKEEAVKAEKERKRQERLAEIAQHREIEEKRKAHDRFAEMSREQALLHNIESDVKAYHEEVKDKKQARLRTIKDVQKDYVATAAAKEEARLMERESEIEQRRAVENSLEQQDAVFRQFAMAKLAEAEQHSLGDHAHILKKVASRNDATIRKPMEPTGHPVLVDTHRRLGFNWNE